MSKKRVHLDNYKKQNEQKVFNSVLEFRKLSRTNIAKQTSLSPASVTLIVDTLINKGYIAEVGTSASTGGRSQKLLGINPKLGSNISFHIREDVISAGNVNAFLELENITVWNISDTSVETVLNNIVEIFNYYKSYLVIHSVSIGVRSPEIFKKSRVSISTSLSSDFITVDEAMRFLLGVPVIFGRPVNYAALGETHTRKTKGEIYYLDLNEEIQLGGIPPIIQEHVAHIKVADQGEVCSCGKRGCLNTFVSSEHVKQNIINQSNTSVDWELISERYHSNNTPDIAFCVDKACHYLGKGIVNISTVLNPSLLILGGDIARLGKNLEEKITQSVRKFGYHEMSDLEISLSTVGENSYLIGGAKEFLQNVFKL